MRNNKIQKKATDTGDPTKPYQKRKYKISGKIFPKTHIQNYWSKETFNIKLLKSNLYTFIFSFQFYNNLFNINYTLYIHIIRKVYLKLEVIMWDTNNKQLPILKLI